MKHCELFHPDDHDHGLQRDGQAQRARPFEILGFVCIDGFDFYFGKGPVMTGPPAAMAAAAETVPAGCGARRLRAADLCLQIQPLHR
jgi:hypothetical protein